MSPYATQILHKAKNEATGIKDKINSFDSFFSLSRLPQHQELKKISSDLRVYSRKFFAFLYPNFRNIRQVVNEFVTDRKNIKHPQIVSKLYEMAELLESAENIMNNSEYAQVLGPLYKGIETDWERIESHISWLQSLKNITGTQAFAEKIIGNINHCRDLAFKLEQRLKNTIEQIETILQKLQIDIETGISIDDTIKKNQELTDKIQTILNAIAPYVKNKDTVIAELPSAFNDYISTEQIRENIENNYYYKELFALAFDGINTDVNKLCTIADWICLLSDEGDIPLNIIKWLLEKETSSRIAVLLDFIDKAKNYLTTHIDTFEKIEQIGKLNQSMFFGKPFYHCEISYLIEKYSECIHQLDYLFLWADYSVVKEKAIRHGLAQLIEAIENGPISTESSLTNLNYSIYNSMAREIVRKHPTLSSFTSASYENTRKRFVELDKKVMALRKEEIASKISNRSVPRGIGSGPVGGFTDLSLISKTGTKQAKAAYTHETAN